MDGVSLYGPADGSCVCEDCGRPHPDWVARDPEGAAALAGLATVPPAPQGLDDAFVPRADALVLRDAVVEVLKGAGRPDLLTGPAVDGLTAGLLDSDPDLPAAEDVLRDAGSGRVRLRAAHAHALGTFAGVFLVCDPRLRDAAAHLRLPPRP